MITLGNKNQFFFFFLGLKTKFGLLIPNMESYFIYHVRFSRYMVFKVFRLSKCMCPSKDFILNGKAKTFVSSSRKGV